MSKEQLNDPTRNWHITAENISTPTTGSNLTLEASANIYLLSGTGTIGNIYFNNNAWFDSSANLNFSFGEGTYENVVKTSTTVPVSPLTNNDLFQTYSFDPSVNQPIYLPSPTTCKVGSWININNFSSTSSITVTDSSGNVYIILAPSTPGTIGGSGVKMLAVSSSAKTGDVGFFAENWICTQSGVTSYTDTNGNVVDLSSSQEISGVKTFSSKIIAKNGIYSKLLVYNSVTTDYDDFWGNIIQFDYFSNPVSILQYLPALPSTSINTSCKFTIINNSGDNLQLKSLDDIYIIGLTDADDINDPKKVLLPTGYRCEFTSYYRPPKPTDDFDINKAWYCISTNLFYNTQEQIDSKATKESPTFTGTPLAPTPVATDNSTKIATTEFVKTQINGITLPDLSSYAQKESPTFTGTTTTIEGHLFLGKETIIYGGAFGLLPIAYNYTGGNIAFKINGITYTLTPAILSRLVNISSDIQEQIDSKAPKDSPTFTGSPLAPTQDTSDDSTKIATTAFVKAQNYLNSVETLDLSSYAPKESPTFTGTTTTIEGHLFLGKETIIYGGAFGLLPIAYNYTGGNIAFKINGITYTLTPAILSRLVNISSDIQEQIDSKAPKESPTFTGTPLVPTPTSIYDNSTKIATTEWVQNLINSLTTGTKISQYIIAYANKVVGFNFTQTNNILGKNYYTHNLFTDGVSFGEYFVSSSGATGIISGYGWIDGIWKASTEGRYNVEVKLEIEYDFAFVGANTNQNLDNQFVLYVKDVNNTIVLPSSVTYILCSGLSAHFFISTKNFFNLKSNVSVFK